MVYDESRLTPTLILLEDMMNRNRHKMVKSICENCGNEFDAQEYRLRQGLERFCSRACNYEWKRNNRIWGKENGKRYFNGGRWIYQWFTQDGKAHNTSLVKYLWENNFGEVPSGYVVRQKDGDANNLSLDNLYLDTPQEVMRGISRLGARGFSPETIEKMRNMKLGKKLTEEHRRHIGVAVKKLWNSDAYANRRAKKVVKTPTKRVVSEEQKIKLSQALKKRYSDIDNYNKLVSERPRGENHWLWRGGDSTHSYPPEFSKKLRREIRERDGGRCRICGTLTSSKDGRVHHIDADKNNNSKENLIFLCHGCHAKIHLDPNTKDPVILAFQSELYRNSH